MFDYASARRMMVEGQIRTNNITDPGIVSGMLNVPRERFLPESWATLAYSDREAPVSEGRLVPTPMVLGKLLQAADLTEEDRVLHISCATGYGSALLGRIVKSVVALDEDAALLARAKAEVEALGLENVTFVNGPLVAGHAANAPYDAILIEGAIERVPDALAAQLAPEGRLLAIVGRGRSAQGTIFRRAGNELSGFPVFDAAAPMLADFTTPNSFVF
jgi:protein-L-isoaspartate(D-aspartate) O-methyltransferase